MCQIFYANSYDIKLGIMLLSVLKAATKENYFKVALQCNFIWTVLNYVFNMYSLTFYNCILKTRREASYSEHILNIQYLKQQI